MKDIKVLLNGCNGKMGQEVTSCIEQTEGVEILCGFDLKDNGIYSFPVYTSFEDIKEIHDVIVDFSIPIATLNILEFAKSNNIPIVIATTGLTDDQMEVVKEASKTIPVFQSANMSFDIFLMQKVLELVSPYLQNTDIEIIEAHHNRKIDAPSGTALMLGNSINKACDNKLTNNLNRLNERKKRAKNEIGYSSIRGGNIVGEHTVKFIGQNDTLEITHKAFSRQLFAEGAIRAAKFLVGKPNKLYNMNDIL